MATIDATGATTSKAGHDYGMAQLLRTKGLSYKQISDQTGIPLAALSRYGQRHDWDIKRDKCVALVSNVVADTMVDRITSHINGIADFADQVIGSLRQRPIDSMEMDDLSKLASVANTFDSMYRRAMRLDEQQGVSKGVNIALTVNAGQPGSANSDRVIELEQDVVEQSKLVDGEQVSEQVSADSSVKD